jgi:hypothetical protein
MWRHSRRSFGQLVRRARRAGTLVRYDRHYCGYSRVASFLDGTCAIWHHESYYALPEPEHERNEDTGATYGHPGDRLRGIE